MPGPQPPRDIYGVASNCNFATVDYFISIFGFQEAVELSNIENPTGNDVDITKIQLALNDAGQLINNYIDSAPPQGKVLIAGSYRRTQATIARYYLDILRPRPVPVHPDDVLYEIKPEYTYRPDLLAHVAYGTKDLWWVFAQRNINTIKDPVYDFTAGTKIYLPKERNITAKLGG